MATKKPVQALKTWGPWKLDRENRTLDLGVYYIHLDGCDLAEAEDWLRHIGQGKTWGTPDCVTNLSAAFKDTLGLDTSLELARVLRYRERQKLDGGR